MIVIATGDKIRGDATTASEVDFTIYGLDNNALSPLANGQLANSIGDLYTANSTDVVTTIILVNTGAAHNHVNLYHTPSAGTARRLIAKDLQLESGYSLHWEGGKVCIISSSGAVVSTTEAELDNKTLDTCVGKGTWTASGTWTLPAFTLGGDAQLSENVGLYFDEALSADGKYSGWVTSRFKAGATLAFGDSVYLASADSRWELTDCDAEATAKGLWGICVLAAANDGSDTTALLFGNVRADAVFPTFTVGAPVFMGSTAGDLEASLPAKVTGKCVRIGGHGFTGDELFFHPENEWDEYA